MFGLTAVVILVLYAQASRGHLVTALLFGVSGLIIGRHCVRRYLARRRMHGEFITRVLVLGKPDSVRVLCEVFSARRQPDTGWSGACIPDFEGAVGEEVVTSKCVVPILGGDRSVEAALSMSGADALAVTAVEHVGPRRMRQLAWRLESMGTDLIVVPGVTDIAGHQLQCRPSTICLCSTSPRRTWKGRQPSPNGCLIWCSEQWQWLQQCP